MTLKQTSSSGEQQSGVGTVEGHRDVCKWQPWLVGGQLAVRPGRGALCSSMRCGPFPRVAPSPLPPKSRLPEPFLSLFNLSLLHRLLMLH